MNRAAGPVRPKLRIGDLLIEAGLISDDQLKSALEVQKQSGGKKLGFVLVDLGVISEEQLIDVLKNKLHTSFVKLQGQQIAANLLQFVPENIARDKMVFPYRLQSNTLILAAADPLDYDTFNQISAASGKTVEAVIATRADIGDAVNRYYSKQRIGAAAEQLNIVVGAKAAEIDIDFEEIETRVGSTPVVKFMNDIIAQAHSKRASDIHIEPMDDESLRVRFRIDGQLIEIVRMSMKAHPSIVTRLKIVSDMDIAEKRIPLDGRFSISVNDTEVNIRAASMPTMFGEKIVLRLLADTKNEILPLESLGFTGGHAKLLRTSIKTPNGIILVTGPTGSGKTTTLYSLLNELTEVGTNIITIEDPVEKVIPGVNQTQVNVKAGLTFAAGLRAVLRQDPDKIMIGEIRDGETADIAARAAITGHLVLASMHTNSAVVAYMRLIDMGVEPYIVASSIVSVTAQRLVRLLCNHCKKEYRASPADISFLHRMGAAGDDFKLCGPGACMYCDYTGHLGRTAVKEVVMTDPMIRDLVVDKAKASDIENYLRRERGQKLMVDDVLELVLDGSVYINEILNMPQLFDGGYSEE
jgi:type IV pilus assembly protein PilB